MDVKLSCKQHTSAIRQVHNIKPIRFVYRMDFQIDQSNEERSPVASTIDPSPMSKSDLQPGISRSKSSSSVQWHITSMSNTVSGYLSSHSYFGEMYIAFFNLDTRPKIYLQLRDCGAQVADFKGQGLDTIDHLQQSARRASRDR
jgi:hypothetical protein